MFFFFSLCLSRGAEQHFLLFCRVFSKVGNSRLHSTQSDCGVRLSTASCPPNKQTGKPRHAGPYHSAVYTRWSLFASSQDRERSKETPIYWNTRPPTAPPPPLPQPLRSNTNVRFIKTCARASHYLMTHNAVSYSKESSTVRDGKFRRSHNITRRLLSCYFFSPKRRGGVCRYFSKRWSIAGVFVVVAIDEK